jgi:pSer/pThr/pTyr-binding forkhead associated (FHA) protein
VSARIILTATGGPLKGREFVFTGRTICPVGRADDCMLHISGDVTNLVLSRRHCVLEIDAPAVRVRDLGSRNGTFVNGRKVGQREKGALPGEATSAERAAVELHDGDRLALGTSEFVVAIRCAEEEAGAAAESPDLMACC